MHSDAFPSLTRPHEDSDNVSTHTHIDPLKSLRTSAEIEGYLTALASIADTLGLDELTYASVFSAISQLSSEQLSLNQSKICLQGAQEELEDHLALMRHELKLIQHWNDDISASAGTKETVQILERKKVALTAKAKEYQRELEDMITQMPEGPAITISELLEHKERLRKTEQELRTKRAKVQAFQGLPPHVELARHELEKARDEQMKLIQLRERLLGRMASGVA